MRRTIAIACFLAFATAARADVVESTANGFTAKTATEISAVPRAVYLALTGQMGAGGISSTPGRATRRT